MLATLLYACMVFLIVENVEPAALFARKPGPRVSVQLQLLDALGHEVTEEEIFNMHPSDQEILELFASNVTWCLANRTRESIFEGESGALQSMALEQLLNEQKGNKDREQVKGLMKSMKRKIARNWLENAALQIMFNWSDQNETISFIDFLNETHSALLGFDGTAKVGSGRRSEVFQYFDDNDQKRIIKVSPIGGDEKWRRDIRPKPARYILPEFVLDKAFQMLSKSCECSFYPSIIATKIVRGKFPKELKDLVDSYSDDQRKKESTKFLRYFPDTQKWLVTEMHDAGSPLDKVTLLKPADGLSIVLQTAVALALAEESFEFEHRDLFPQTVYLKSTSRGVAAATFQDGGLVETEVSGHQVVITPTAESRALVGNCIIFEDLEVEHPKRFRPTRNRDANVAAYQSSAEQTRFKFGWFAPKTNIYWLRALAQSVLEKLYFTHDRLTNPNFTIASRKLRLLNQTMLSFYDSAYDFVKKNKDRLFLPPL